MEYINSCLMALSQVKVTIAYWKFTVCSFVQVKSPTNLYNPTIVEPKTRENYSITTDSKTLVIRLSWLIETRFFNPFWVFFLESSFLSLLFISSWKGHVVCSYWNGLSEAILISTLYTSLFNRRSKNIPKLSPFSPWRYD